MFQLVPEITGGRGSPPLHFCDESLIDMEQPSPKQIVGEGFYALPHIILYWLEYKELDGIITKFYA